jgi:hypothetical protein
MGGSETRGPPEERDETPPEHNKLGTQRKKTTYLAVNYHKALLKVATAFGTPCRMFCEFIYNRQ